MKKKKLIIWDFDGPIVDSRKLALELTQTQFENVTAESHRDLFNGNIYTEIKKLKYKKNFNEEDFQKFLKYSYWPRKLKLKPVKGISGIIKKLSTDYLMVINSSSKDSGISEYLRKNNLLKYFKKIYGIEISKNKEEKFRMILEEMKIDSDDCVLITDTAGDIIEAKAVKIKSIGILWGYQSKKHLIPFSAEVSLVENPSLLLKVIKEFFLENKDFVQEKSIIQILKQGGIGVLPTDTLYGVVGRAEDEDTVEMIYKIKGRNEKKPFIILISDIKDLKKFGISDAHIRTNGLMLKKLWPGKVSVILPTWTSDVQVKKFKYLHRGNKSLAFRLPKKKSLIEILKKTGPLVAPSANPEGKKPAENIRQAKNYFGDKVDFYMDGGTLKGKPSVLIEISKNGDIGVLRGNIKI